MPNAAVLRQLLAAFWHIAKNQRAMAAHLVFEDVDQLTELIQRLHRNKRRPQRIVQHLQGRIAGSDAETPGSGLKPSSTLSLHHVIFSLAHSDKASWCHSSELEGLASGRQLREHCHLVASRTVHSGFMRTSSPGAPSATLLGKKCSNSWCSIWHTCVPQRIYSQKKAGIESDADQCM